MSQPFLEKCLRFQLNPKSLSKPSAISLLTNAVNFLILGVILCSFNTNAAKKKKLFDVNEIEAPFTITQPILALNLFKNNKTSNLQDAQNDTKELVVMGVDENGLSWLAIYAINKTSEQYVLIDMLPIDKKFFAYDVSDDQDYFTSVDNLTSSQIKTDKTEKLYFLSHDEVVSLQPSLSKEISQSDKASVKECCIDTLEKSRSSFVHEQEVKSIYLMESATYLSRKNFIRDLNQDGIDDIVLDDFQSINVWTAKKSASEEREKEQKSLRLSPRVSLNRGGVTFTPKSIYYGDFNFDQMLDVAWIEKGELKYFAQQLDGNFSSNETSIAINEGIYGIRWWDMKTAEGEGLDQSSLVHRVVENIKDVNGDGILDIIVQYTQSSGVLDRTNNYEFYFGKKELTPSKDNTAPASYTIQFPTIADTTIRADGTLTGLNVIDINQDNRYEVLLSSFELSIGNVIGALLSGGIDQNVLLFALNNDNVFTEKPIAEKEVELSFSLSKGQSGSPVIILEDINADGLHDLILSDDDELKIYKGLKKKSKRRFAKKALKQSLPLPKEGSNVLSYDLNNDQKNDFVISYSRLDKKGKQNKFAILITK
ncbi:MAG: FG-GAP repeat domain-containing protein [Colwellia sp.]